jgi:hypothetical protein
VRSWWLFAVVACGRIDFGAHVDAGDGGAPGSGSSSGSDAATQLVCTPFDISIPSTNVSAFPTTLAWTGDHYVLWTASDSSLGVVAIADDGTYGAFDPLASMSDGSTAGNGQAIAWGSGATALVWFNEAGEAELLFVDDNFNLIAPLDTAAPSNAYAPSVAWADDRFVVAWGDAGSGFDITEIAPNGAVLDGERFTTANLTISGITATAGAYILPAYDPSFAPMTISVPRPLVDTAFVQTPLALGFTSEPMLAIGIAPDGVAYAVQDPGTGSGGVELVGADGTTAGPVVQLPLVQTQSFDSVAVGTFGSALRIVGMTGGNEYVTVDFDPSTQTFSAMHDLGAVPGGASSFPMTASAPGRFAITMSRNGSAGAFSRVIQQCE